MDWSALETPLYDEPRFYIEGADKSSDDLEISRVSAFRRELRKTLPAARVVAIPNAAKRGQKAINQAKAEGAKWGFPDVMVIHGPRIVFFEWKGASKRPSDHQVDWCNWLHDQGHRVACVRTVEGAFACLEEWGWFNE